MDALANLIRQVQSGEQAAYQEIVARFQDMAVGYSYARLGDMALAEDVAQEAFIKAYYSLSDLRDPLAFPGWFRQIVFSQVNRLQRKQKQPWLPLDAAANLPASSDTPVQIVEHQEIRDRVFAAIATLPEAQREVVVLFYMSEYSQQEVSEFLDIPTSTVKMRLYHARKKLAERLKMVQDNLNTQRPSKDNAFTEKVIQLFQATANGDAGQVKTLLQADASLAQAKGREWSAIWHNETPALHQAVMRGQKDIVDLLLAHGADINEKDRFGWTPLHQAMDLGFMPDYAALKMPQLLLERGAEKDIFAVLWGYAAEAEKLAALEKLLQDDPSLANAIGPSNARPLCYAWPKAAELLLAHGADPYAPIEDARGWTTPVRWIVQHNADYGRFMLNRLKIEIDIFLACMLGDVDNVIDMLKPDESLVHAKTGPDHVLQSGLTLLHLAARKGQTELVKHLLTLGADINARAEGVNDMTPLMLTVWLGPQEMFDPLPPMSELLQKNGVYRLLPEMPRLLVEHGADLTMRDSAKELTALGWAEADLVDDQIDRSEVADLLRGLGAKV